MLKKPEHIYTRRDVHIGKINAGLELRVRVDAHKDTVKEYAEAMKAGATFPPLECAEVDGEILLYDGFLRFEAYRQAKITDVSISLRVGASHDDAFLWAHQRRQATLGRNAVGY